MKAWQDRHGNIYPNGTFETVPCGQLTGPPEIEVHKETRERLWPVAVIPWADYEETQAAVKEAAEFISAYIKIAITYQGLLARLRALGGQA